MVSSCGDLLGQVVVDDRKATCSMATTVEQEKLLKDSESEERPYYQSTKGSSESPSRQHSEGKRRLFPSSPTRQELVWNKSLPSATTTATGTALLPTTTTHTIDQNETSFSLWRILHHLFGSVLFSVFFYIFLFPLLFLFVLGIIIAAIVFGVYCIYLACTSSNPPRPLPLLVFLPFVLVLYGILLVFGAQRRSSHLTLTVFWGRLCFSLGVIAGFSTPFYLWHKQLLSTLELMYAGVGTLLLTISFAMTILLLESDMLSPRQVISTHQSNMSQSV